MATFIDWKPVDPQNPPQPTEENTSFLFFFNGKVFDGWPLHDAESGLDMRDGDGYPVWEIAERAPLKLGGVRWYAETYNQPQQNGAAGAGGPSYNDVLVYVNGVGIKITDNFAYELNCTRSAGWRLWWYGKEPRLLGGEFDGGEFRIEVNGVTVCVGSKEENNTAR